ncbi:hypothetical protein OHA18_24300 [Kribbella sp. NBC_00709]|uniref:hypothetical protein n=1 Tax=Kribbella sp. NBC_00709 TaxID=2975972 RepID=UPI002E27D707|nr:hypothetical protein [Kribbella sp. NBC_00709]
MVDASTQRYLPGVLDYQLQRDSGLTHFEYSVSSAAGRGRRADHRRHHHRPPEQLAQLKDIADTILAKVDPGTSC